MKTWIRGLSAATLAMFLLTSLGCGGDGGKPSPKPKPSTSGSSSKPSADDSAAETTPSAASASTDAPAAGGWGTLSGTFIYDGAPPAQGQVQVTKDVEYCSKHQPLNEQLVVNSENKGIQNIVIMLAPGRGETVQAHESYGDPAAAKVKMDNQWCRFAPHVQFVQAGGTLEFGNEDEVGHNVKGDPFANAAFNQTVASNSTLDVTMTAAERLPFAVSCTIHPWMTGWVVVQDHPYVAISGEDGKFELKNVPSGAWEFQVWQEKAGYLKQLKVAGADVKLSRGKWKVNVYDEADADNAAKNTLGDVVVPVSNFE